MRPLLHPLRVWFFVLCVCPAAITYADLYTLAAVVAIEEMGGPVIKWKPGRTDTVDGKHWKSPDGRLPDGDKGASHMRDIFYNYGFNDQEITALAGAHALGRCVLWCSAPLLVSLAVGDADVDRLVCAVAVATRTALASKAPGASHLCAHNIFRQRFVGHFVATAPPLHTHPTRLSAVFVFA